MIYQCDELIDWFNMCHMCSHYRGVGYVLLTTPIDKLAQYNVFNVP